MNVPDLNKDVEHKFNPFLCPAHVAHCNCPDLATHACNPYQGDDLLCLEPSHQVAPECSDENCLR